MKCTFSGRECGLMFAGGLAIGLAIREFLTKEQMREIALKGMEQSISLRDSAKENFTIIRNKTTDIYNEAVTKKFEAIDEEFDFDISEIDLAIEEAEATEEIEATEETEATEEIEATEETISSDEIVEPIGIAVEYKAPIESSEENLAI
ncbi:MAG: hypothetical protein R3Y12_07150 [Clostridia bacterium]